MVDEKRYAEAVEVPTSAGDRLDLAVGRLHEMIGGLEKAISPILAPEYPVAEISSIDPDHGSLLHMTAARLEGQASWLLSIIERVEL